MVDATSSINSSDPLEAETAADEVDAERALVKRFFDERKRKTEVKNGGAMESGQLGQLLDRAKEILNGGSAAQSKQNLPI